MKLKHAILTKVVVVLFFSSAVYGQDESTTSGTIGYGFKAGAAMTEFSSSYHTGSRLGFTAGGFGTYGFNDMVSIQAEVAYLQTGGTYVQFRDESRFGSVVDLNTKNVKNASVAVHSVYLPVQALLSPFSNPIMPKFLIGPYAAYNVASIEYYQKTGQTNGGVFVTAAGEDVVTDQYEDFQFGAVAGLQLHVPTEGSFDLIVGATYSYGITPIRKSFSYIDLAEVTEDVTANALLITVGVKF